MKLEEEIKQPKFRSETQKLVVNLTFTGSWLGIRMIKFFRQYGLSPQQYNVMRILRGQFPKPASVNLLMERMLDKTSNASRLVDKLELKKLVERTKCKEDRRRADVVITKMGLELLAKIDEDNKQFETELVSLSEAECNTLNKLLDKLRD